MFQGNFVLRLNRSCNFGPYLVFNSRSLFSPSLTNRPLQQNTLFKINSQLTRRGIFNYQAFQEIIYSLPRQFSKMSDSEDKKAELKKRLTPLQYHITQEKGTERPYSGKLNKCSESGTYSCIVCDQPLFSSETKFDSGCGWPAFNNVLDQGKVKLTKDTSNGMVRTEVQCSNCNAHLGHVFGDGPAPSRKRFCINSEAMQFHQDHPAQDHGFIIRKQNLTLSGFGNSLNIAS